MRADRLNLLVTEPAPDDEGPYSVGQSVGQGMPDMNPYNYLAAAGMGVLNQAGLDLGKAQSGLNEQISRTQEQLAATKTKLQAEKGAAREKQIKIDKSLRRINRVLKRQESPLVQYGPWVLGGVAALVATVALFRR